MNSWRISYTGRNRGLAVALLAALVLLAGVASLTLGAVYIPPREGVLALLGRGGCL